MTDTAGVPWQGRSLPAAPFAGDDGRAQPGVLAALASGDEAEIVASLATARLFVAVVAVETGHRVDDADAQADMGLVTLTLPDGRLGIPAFTSVEALTAWDADARPVPASANRVAQAAIAERADAIVLDLGSAHDLALRPSQVWALAMGREWTPAHRDDHVGAALAAAVLGEPTVLAASRGLDGQVPGRLVVTLTLTPGLSPDEVAALATRVGERLATDGEVRARIDELTFRIRAQS